MFYNNLAYHPPAFCLSIRRGNRCSNHRGAKPTAGRVLGATSKREQQLQSLQIAYRSRCCDNKANSRPVREHKPACKRQTTAQRIAQTVTETTLEPQVKFPDSENDGNEAAGIKILSSRKWWFDARFVLNFLTWQFVPTRGWKSDEIFPEHDLLGQKTWYRFCTALLFSGPGCFKPSCPILIIPNSDREEGRVLSKRNGRILA